MMSFRTFTVRQTYITEATTGMVDISILNADKAFTKKPVEFFFQLDGQGNTISPREFIIEEKFDGTKLTLFRNNEDYDPKDYTKNWIVAYKNNILHPNDFSSGSSKKAREQGIGMSQYRLVHEHLKKNNRNLKSVPKNTEFFVEFLMRKATLTRDYDNKHSMILIGYSTNTKIDQQTEFRLYTKETKLEQDQNEYYANLLGLDGSEIVFDGEMNSYKSIHTGAKSKALKSLIAKEKQLIDRHFDKLEWAELYQLIKKIFLAVVSKYGGKTEGVVIKDKKTKKIYKFLQDDQHDKETRDKIKSKYIMDRPDENAYFTKIREFANNILKNIDLDQPHDTVLREISAASSKYKLPSKIHAKKNPHQVREDLQLTTKGIYEKMLKGWAGVVGKFRILTNEHINMIEYALEKYKGVSVMLVTGSERDPGLITVNKELLEKIFKGKNVEVFIAKTGNILRLEQKTRNPIVAYVCGPDRKTAYEGQLQNMNSDAIVDIYDKGKRDSVSATKAEEALRKGDLGTLARIVHPVAFQNINKWSKFYKE